MGPSKVVDPFPGEVSRLEASDTSPMRTILQALRLFLLWRRDNERAVELRKASEAYKSMNRCIRNHSRWILIEINYRRVTIILPSYYFRRFIHYFIDVCLSQRPVDHLPVGEDFLPVSVSEQKYYQPVFQLLTDANKLKDILLELMKQIADLKLPAPWRVSISGWADLLLDVHFCGDSPGKYMLDRHDYTFIVNIMKAVPTYFRVGMLATARSAANDVMKVVGAPELFEDSSDEMVECVTGELSANVLEETIVPDSPSTSSSEEWEVLKESPGSARGKPTPGDDDASEELDTRDEASMPESSNCAVKKSGSTWLGKTLAVVLPKWLWG